MKYLVDANILSEPTKPSPNLNVLNWLRSNERDIAIDAVILGELRFGILILPKGKKRTSLERWFDAGISRVQCIPWDADTGLRWAELLAGLRKTGKTMSIKASFIATPALVHGLAVVIRNSVNFAKTGVRIVDSFAG